MCNLWAEIGNIEGSGGTVWHGVARTDEWSVLSTLSAISKVYEYSSVVVVVASCFEASCGGRKDEIFLSLLPI